MDIIRTEITELARPSAPAKRFDRQNAHEEMKQIVERRLRGRQYDSEECAKISKELADEIRAKIRLISDNRFKICVSVTIIGQKGQGIRSENKCYFDADADTELRYVYQNDDIICIANMYAVYYY